MNRRINVVTKMPKLIGIISILFVAPLLLSACECEPVSDFDQAKRVVTSQYKSMRGGLISRDFNVDQSIEITNIDGPKMSHDTDDVRYIEYTVDMCGGTHKMTTFGQCGSRFNVTIPRECMQYQRPYK